VPAELLLQQRRKIECWDTVPGDHFLTLVNKTQGHQAAARLRQIILNPGIGHFDGVPLPPLKQIQFVSLGCKRKSSGAVRVSLIFAQYPDVCEVNYSYL
jgi:hypothetical protein